MEIMFRTYSFVLFFLILFSCSTKEEKTPEIELTGKKKVYPEIINPDKIRLRLNHLIVLESPSMDSSTPPIHFIDLPTQRFLYSVGTIGFGPGEISDATSIEFDESDSIFFIYSSIDKKISKFSTNKLELALNQVKQKNDFFKAYSVLRFTDSTFIGLTVDSPARLVEFNKNGDPLNSFGSLENFSERKDLNNFNLSKINMGWFSSNSSKSHFAIASIFTNRIEIFSRQNGKFESIYLNPKEHTKFDLIAESNGQSVYWDLSSPYFFRDIVLTENAIIALFGGLSENQIQSNSDIAKSVYIFSLTGKLIAKLNLNTSIRSLAVSEDLTKLYGISTDSEPGIVEFEIPKFGKKIE